MRAQNDDWLKPAASTKNGVQHPANGHNGAMRARKSGALATMPLLPVYCRTCGLSVLVTHISPLPDLCRVCGDCMVLHGEVPE